MQLGISELANNDLEVIFEDVVMNNHTFSMIWRGMHFDQNILWFNRQAPISLQDSCFLFTIRSKPPCCDNLIHFDIFAFVCKCKYL